jgi:hypothetical protein
VGLDGALGQEQPDDNLFVVRSSATSPAISSCLRVSDSAIPAGSTHVTVTLDAADGGTRLTLQHHGLPNDELCEGHRVAM